MNKWEFRENTTKGSNNIRPSKKKYLIFNRDRFLWIFFLVCLMAQRSDHRAEKIGFHVPYLMLSNAKQFHLSFG